MKTIWKYHVLVNDEFLQAIPSGGSVLCVQCQNDLPEMWVAVDTDAPLVTRKFFVVGTGGPMPEVPIRYIGTFQMYDGTFVGHLFEELVQVSHLQAA